MAAVRQTVTDRSDTVRSLQSRYRGWLLMWSKWRQTYTAFSGVTATPLIIDDASFDRFLARIKQVEQKRARELTGTAT